MASRKTPLIALVDSAAQMGGVEFSTLYLAQQAQQTGQFRYVVICPEDGDLPQRCRESSIPVWIVPRGEMQSTSLRLGGRYLPNPLSWFANGSMLAQAARRVARDLRALQVDLVCTKGLPAHFYGGLAARLSGAPCVWHVQDLVSQRAGNLYAQVLGRAGNVLAKHVIADGHTIREQLAPFLAADQMTVIHNGVDTERFSPHVDGRPVRAEWSVQEGEILIGNAARLTPWKGQDHLVRAFAAVADEFPAAKLVLVGAPVFDDDRFERDLRELVARTNLAHRVIFAGFRWDLPEVLAALDVFVHSAIMKDTSPLAVVSAMASGKAILSTNVSGVAELFTPGQDAILVEPGSSEALIGGLREVLASAGRRAGLGQAARTTAERDLSLPEFTRRCEQVFEAVLGAPIPAPAEEGSRTTEP